MSAFSDFYENGIQDHLLRTASLPKPNGVWLALCSGIPHDTHTGSTLPEVAGGNYARWNFGPPSDSAFVRFNPGGSGILYNASGVSPILNWSGARTDVSGMALCDAPTGGNVIIHGTLSTSKTITSTDNLAFASGTLGFVLQ
jgi:hypothetical protein